jgi:pimeloyl-ACP methyl ester carboxylesterase
MRDKAVERLFSLFASRDRAEALAGDLAEERTRRGPRWYWLHVVGITFALLRNVVTEAPLRVLALAVAVAVVFAAPAIAGVAGVYMFPVAADWTGWLALSVFWWGGALAIGATLVTLAPQRGMTVCAIVALISASMLLTIGSTIEPARFTRMDRMFFNAGLATTVALVAGGALRRRATIVVTLPFAAAVALAASVVVFVTGSSSPSAHSNDWRDPSPHMVSLVPVDNGVRLEVLDWGGAGPALLLLAGLSDTAHVFDDVAPDLATRYRVVAVTRRGHPGSSAPADGYSRMRLAEDIVRVMDAAGLRTPVAVGHSWAGEEMHVLASRFPTRIAGLVYVDAAFDRGDAFEEHEAAARALPGPPEPERSDLASFAALRAYLTRTYGPAAGNWPEARLRARYVANPDGTVRGRWTPERHVLQAYSAESRALATAYKPDPIDVPALAIYAAPKSADELMRPWYDATDPAVRAKVTTLYRLERENVARHERWFRTFDARGRVIEIPGGHDLLVSNPAGVVQQIDEFVSSLRDKR